MSSLGARASKNLGRLGRVTRGYMKKYWITRGSRGLQEVTKGYKCLQEVTCGF